MKLFNLLVLINGLLVFTSCNEKEKAAEKIHATLMQVHDAAMAKMDQMYNLQKALAAIPDTALSPEKKEKIQQCARDLKAADESMMHWMRSYKEPEKSVDPEKKSSYYQQELDKINLVKAVMDSSTDSASTYLKNYAIGDK